MTSEYIEISISVKNGYVRTNRDARDQAINEFPDRFTAAAANSIERGCLLVIGRNSR